ncbi:MAG: hypothetical protein GY801_29290 [bacterium]|nr:hypothetical protein [bacterium]
MSTKSSIRLYHAFFKLHGIIGGIIGVFIAWMVLWGVLLGNREPIRELLTDFGNYVHPPYRLDFPDNALSLDDALTLGWDVLGAQEGYSRIEVKWESGAPIYRIRFSNTEKSEVTIHAVTGKILIFPTNEKEIKKIAQDFHVLSLLPDNLRWIFDVLTLVVIGVTLSGILLFFLKKKKISGSPTRKLHNISSMLVCIPFLIMAVTGILLNHEEWSESLSKKNVSSSPTQEPPLDYAYDTLPVSSQKAVEIFQDQFSEPVVLRRAVLAYSKEAQTLTWQVEPNQGMRVTTVIDAYTGEIIKSSHAVVASEFIDQIHEWFLVGEFSKYVVDVIAILLCLALVTGWMLTPQTLRRRAVRYTVEDIPIEYSLAEVVAHQKEYLHNISIEGLCFRSHSCIEKGTTVYIAIPLLTPVFQEKATVAWCAKKNDSYDIGVEFVGNDTKSHADIVQQMCDIEDYKHEILHKDGRKLSGEEAAVEWLSTRRSAS